MPATCWLLVALHNQSPNARLRRLGPAWMDAQVWHQLEERCMVFDLAFDEKQLLDTQGNTDAINGIVAALQQG